MEEKQPMFSAKVNNEHSTTKIGYVFYLLAVVMIVVKYILPAFIVLKVADPYPGWIILVIIIIGLVSVYMNQDYFGQLFGLGKKAAAKKLGVEDETK